MFIALILKEEELSFYGDVPEVPFESDESAEITYLEPGDWPLLNEHFIDEINELCDTWFDLGDADYLHTDQCKKLKDWLLRELEKELPERLKAIYELLLSYCQRAIEMGTGVVLEP